MKRRHNITLDSDTYEQLMQYAFENHIQGGLSGVISHIAWNDIKVKNKQIRGQISFTEKK